MPELPEVETVRRTLAPAIGMRVTGVWVSGLPLRSSQRVDQSELEQAACGRRITAVRRLGKYLLIDMDGPRSLLVHLGMSGRLRLVEASAAVAPHTHVAFALTSRGGKHELRYSDPRRFGQVSWLIRGREREHPSLAKLGTDPLAEGVTGEQLHALTRGSRRALKLFLLDQHAIAGVGNIYASEALWQARIHPAVPAHRLSRPRADALAEAVRMVLERALEHGGTSLRDFVNADGHAGTHSHYLWVYDREGQPCAREGCGHVIRRTVTQGRATFHCPGCQKR